MNVNKMVSIQIIEDYALIMNSLKYILNKTETFEVTNCFSTVKEFAEQEKEKSPNIVIVDLNYNASHGKNEINIIKQKSPNTKIAIFSRTETDSKNEDKQNFDLYLSLKNGYDTIPQKIQELFANM